MSMNKNSIVNSGAADDWTADSAIFVSNVNMNKSSQMVKAFRIG